MGPGDKDKGKDSNTGYSYLSWDVAHWVATTDGWTVKDTAEKTGCSESQAKEAMDTAREDASN